MVFHELVNPAPKCVLPSFQGLFSRSLDKTVSYRQSYQDCECSDSDVHRDYAALSAVARLYPQYSTGNASNCSICSALPKDGVARWCSQANTLGGEMPSISAILRCERPFDLRASAKLIVTMLTSMMLMIVSANILDCQQFDDFLAKTSDFAR